MAKIKTDTKRREAIQKFIELYQPQSVEDIYKSLKDMLCETIPQMLETELESQIGYPKGNKDVLGMWVGENELSKFWITVINKLKNRGIKDIFILQNNWVHLSSYFKYSHEVRTIIYTTNAMENFNRQLRKVIKSKSIFPSDTALSKSLYLAMLDSTSKWTSRIRNWDYILNHLAIYFEGRIEI